MADQAPIPSSRRNPLRPATRFALCAADGHAHRLHQHPRHRAGRSRRRAQVKVSALALLLMLLASAGCMYVKSTLDKVEAFGTPTDVAVRAANRRLTVAWREIPGATRYKIAVRPKNQLVPAWREYTTPYSLYTIMTMWAMSGMEYEVRVAAVNAAGQSEWSAPVSITAPALQAAPADAIESSPPPYFVGQSITVSLGQRPFANRSGWHWFICSADGSDCKVLPKRQGRPGWQYFMEHAMEGKRVSVQVDYDKEGVSYSATAVLGVVGATDASTTHLYGPQCGSLPTAPSRPQTIPTHLYDLQLQSARVWHRWNPALGGALAPLGNDLLVVTPRGRLALVSPTGEVACLEGNVPMNKAELQAHPDQANFDSNNFRVADILLRQHSAGRYDLFVTHHYFTGECIRFRLSATTLLFEGADVSVSSAWRTIFDAEPCLNAASDQAGGRMVTDGPDHLLVVIGDHQQDWHAQDPASHLGKLVRIEIETGRAELLAFGLRNPQGLAWDAAGTVWETEHGPHGGDELNLLEPGGNYGWPQVSYGVEYGRKVNVPNAEEVGRHEGFTKPVFAWVPSIGISNLIVNDERWFPLWRDDLLISSLSGHALFRVRRDSTDVQYVERIDIGHRIRDLAQMPDGRLALLVDEGRIHFLRRSYAHCADKSQWDRNVYAVDCADTAGTVAATGAQLYGLHCSGCHNLKAEKHGRGPHLVGVLGRQAGAVRGYLFSDALSSLDEVWTPAHLERFLANPRAFAPGTSKSSLHLTPAEARAIADFIGH